MEFIVELGLVIVASAALSFAGRYFKQPPLVAYIITGILLGSLGLDVARDKEVLDIIAEVGIILMLYIAGLKTHLSEFAASGKEVLVVGPFKDAVMIAVGFGFGTFLLGLGGLEALYLGIALTLSSTIIIIKTLTSRKEVGAPHGRVLLGIMLFQDLIAMSALALFTGLASGSNSVLISIGLILLKGTALFILLYALGKSMVTTLFNTIAENPEGVFLLGLCWAFMGVLIAHLLGFSIEIAAFIAGMSIAHLPFSFEIRDKLQGLQDFGLLLFFFTIGVTLDGSLAILKTWLFWGLVVLVMLGIPLLTQFLARLIGFDKKKTFLVSLMPIQVSEFSIILVITGLSLGQISQELFTLIVLLTIVTMILSSSILNNLNGLYHFFDKKFKFGSGRERRTALTLKHHIVIFGLGGLGLEIVQHFKGKKNIVAVEWDPQKAEEAKKHGCILLYGDAGDSDVWDEANLQEADLIVSTIGENLDDDLRIGRWIRKHHPRSISIAETNHPSEVKMLKDAGFDYVILQDEAEWRLLREYLTSANVHRRLHKNLI